MAFDTRGSWALRFDAEVAKLFEQTYVGAELP